MALPLPGPFVGGLVAKDLAKLPEEEYRAAMAERLDQIQQNFEKVALQYPLRDENLSTRTVRGTVSTAGAIVRGTGFTIVRNSTGDYTITFTTAFAAVPVIVAFTGTTAGATVVKGSGATTPTTTVYRVVTFTSTTGAQADCEFHFIAMAP